MPANQPGAVDEYWRASGRFSGVSQAGAAPGAYAVHGLQQPHSGVSQADAVPGSYAVRDSQQPLHARPDGQYAGAPTNPNSNQGSQPPLRVDVPYDPKLPPHPEGDDAYNEHVMRKHRDSTMLSLQMQRNWGHWLATSVTLEVVRRAANEQYSANLVGSHTMLYAAVLQSVPDVPAMQTIRTMIEDAALQPYLDAIELEGDMPANDDGAGGDVDAMAT